METLKSLENKGTKLLSLLAVDNFTISIKTSGGMLNKLTSNVLFSLSLYPLPHLTPWYLIPF